ncbi:hypothetical protein STVA_43990 [Allostella vacuolata]|nr:hypothetical protein STVA_43990 [Stella vacuolata]
MTCIRRFTTGLKAFAVSAAAVALLAAPAAAQTFPDPSDEAKLLELAKQEGKLVWYISAPLEPMKAVATEFEKAYPGVKVEVLRIVGPQQYQRFMQETQAGQHTADLVSISDRPLMESLAEEKHLASWKVPSHDRLPAQARLGTAAYAQYVSDSSIVYNANKVTPEEVALLASDWKAILDPRFKGRFAVTTQKCGTCYLALHMFMDPKLKGTYGPDFVRKLAAQKPVVYSDVLVVLDRVIAGEVDFAYWSFENGAMARWRQGAPIRWVRPEPTPVAALVFQGVSSHAPHPNAARLFQNWITSEAGLAAFQARYGSAPLLAGSEDLRDVRKEPWYKPITKVYEPDYDRWAAQYDKDMGFWINLIRAQ